MIAVLRIPQAIYVMQIFASAFLAILFLQSGIDKIVDRRGNFEWLKGHFAQEPVGRTRSRTADLHHGSRDRSRRAQRRRLFADYCFERFGNRVLWGNSFGRSDYGTVLWAANGERLCWCSGACSLLSAYAGCDLSARTTVI